MFDLLCRPQPASPPEDPPRHWPAAALDLLDLGVMLVGAEAQVLLANRAARIELAQPDHPLQLLGAQLRARCSVDVAALRAALHDAGQRGLRRLLTLDRGGVSLPVAVLPLRHDDAPQEATSLLLLGQQGERVPMAVHCFARSHALTSAEDLVLQGLCRGLTPREIAQQHGVALSTVRTQLASIRAKTRCDSLRELLRCVAQLPPMAAAIAAAA